MEEQKNLILFFAGHGQCGEHGLAWFFMFWIVPEPCDMALAHMQFGKELLANRV